MQMIEWSSFLEDALFAAMAAIGFSSISHTPQRTYIVCALAAACGHATRYLLMQPFCGNMNIILAGTLAAFVVGLVAVALAPVVKVPAEACFFPALLPMIPGMYAYRTISALVACVTNLQEAEFMHNLYVLCFNGFTCVFIVIGMVIGANLPVFIFKKISFQATR